MHGLFQKGYEMRKRRRDTSVYIPEAGDHHPVFHRRRGCRDEGAVSGGNNLTREPSGSSLRGVVHPGAYHMHIQEIVKNDA